MSETNALSVQTIHIYVAGPGLDLDNATLRHAGGEQNWVVACECGVRDDDGERMLCCEVCGLWKHAHCSGIRDSDPDPPDFTCAHCSARPVRRGTCAARRS